MKLKLLGLSQGDHVSLIKVSFFLWRKTVNHYVVPLIYRKWPFKTIFLIQDSDWKLFLSNPRLVCFICVYVSLFSRKTTYLGHESSPFITLLPQTKSFSLVSHQYWCFGIKTKTADGQVRASSLELCVINMACNYTLASFC